ncbi:MAG: hypothetical protein FRX49_03896 [Trebouxia sp. A1-2]|nr:MAG: hypothetical protein FRX49_03896 [Trebouxia sp. A1-2]
MPGDSRRNKINQPVDAASKEQSDLFVASEVYEQLRQGVEPKSLLEQVDDAICAVATSGKGQIPGPILRLCKSKLQLYQTVELWKRNKLNEIEALGTLHTTQLSEDLRTKFLSALVTSRQGAEENGSLLCGIFYVRLSQAIMLPVLPLTLPHQLADFLDPSAELMGQKKHLCDFEQLPAHKSTDHLKMLLRHEVEKAWDANKHQRSEGNLVAFFTSRVVAHKLQEAGLLDRERQQALCSLVQAFHVEGGVGEHQKHAHDPEMHRYQHKTSTPRHVHAAMHKRHLRASKANSLAAEEQMKLAHQAVKFVLDDIKKGQCSKDCLARLQLLSKVSLEAVAEMHKKESQHAVCSEHEAKAMMALIPAAGQVTRHAWLHNNGTDSSLTWPARTEVLNEDMPNKAIIGQWIRWPGQAPSQLLPAESVASVAKLLKKPPLGYSPMPLDALPAAVHHELTDCPKVVNYQTLRDTYVGPLLDACNSLQQATQTMYDGTPAVIAGIGTLLQDYLEHVLPGNSGLADTLSLSQASLLSGGGFERLMRNRGQLIVSLAEHLDKPSVAPSPDRFLATTIATLHSINVTPRYRLELRKAVLAEIVAAVKLLVRCQQFSVGMAVAVSGHIRHHLGPALDWQHSDERVYLEHAALLQLEPLQELLTFLWNHLSLKMQLLEPYIRAHQLLCTPSADTPLSALEVHPDGTMQFSLHCLQELSTNSPSAQTSGSGQESDSRVLVCSLGQETWKYCEKDALAQGALDAMLNSNPGSMKAHVQSMLRDLSHEKHKLEGIRTACRSFTEDHSDRAMMARDPFQMEDSVHDTFTLSAWGNIITPAHPNFNMQTACEDRLTEIQQCKENLHEYSADLDSANTAADDMCQVMDDAAEGDYRDDKDSIGAAASAALKAIRMQASPCYHSLIQRMDAAALKHMFFQKRMRNTCLEAALLKAHSTVLKRELIQKAQEHHGNQLMVDNHAVVKCVPSKAPSTHLWKLFLEWVLSCIVVIADHFRARAADQMMQELVDAETKPHAKKTKKKKKKKAAKPRDDMQQQEAKLDKELLEQQGKDKVDVDDDSELECMEEPSTGLGMPCVYPKLSTISRAAQDSVFSEATSTGNIWEQSHTVLSDQSWSKVDRKKERRNKGLPTQPDSHLSRFQPMPQPSQNDDEFKPASDWPIQSERGPWSLSKPSLPPAPCPDQEVATALQSPVHEALPESSAQSAPLHEQIKLLPSEREKMSFQHNRAMYTPGPWTERNRHKQGLIWQRPDESRYHPDPEMALQASLADGVQASAAQVHDIARQVASQQQQPASSAQQAAGLHNATGEFNCFLNVIVQCLWHCTCFHTAVMAWPTAVFQEHEVASALRDLFGQLCYKEQGQNPHHPVDPTFLRHALAGLPGARFQVGEMSDAGEVVMALYEQLAPVAAKANQPGLLDHMFGLHVKEEVHCCKCSATTHEHEYVQYFYVAMATGIANQEVLKPGQPLGCTLREMEAHSSKSCDDENGGCGVRNRVLHSLVSQPPEVFTMQLAWQTDNESKQDIKAAMLGLREVLDLADMYLGIEHEAFVYHIRSMVCYYGQHYIAYVLLSDSLWYMFDDARVLQVGQWTDVVTKCSLGRTQPSIFFFEQGGTLQVQA